MIIPVRDRWDELRTCLSALAAQEDPPSFETIVVDDGSTVRPPEAIIGFVLPGSFRIVAQEPRGISAARNTGLAIARGENVVFVDSDCIPDVAFLTAANKAMHRFPEDPGFQAHLRGSNGSLAGRMEGLRIETVQRLKQTDSGHVMYVNTSGFAVRSSFLGSRPELFDTRVRRGEDSLLLAELIAAGTPPRFMPEAIVEHCPRMSVARYVLKHFRIGCQAEAARARLRRTTIALFTPGERGRFLRSMWQRSRAQPLGSVIFGLVLVAYALELTGRGAARIGGRRAVARTAGSLTSSDAPTPVCAPSRWPKRKTE